MRFGHNLCIRGLVGGVESRGLIAISNEPTKSRNSRNTPQYRAVESRGEQSRDKAQRACLTARANAVVRNSRVQWNRS